MNLTYLASPYSKYHGGRHEAFTKVSHKAAQLMMAGENIFCPIAHSHPIEKYGMKTDQDGDFWLNQDFAVLQHCNKVKVYRMHGWDESIGVKREIEFANERGIPVEYID